MATVNKFNLLIESSGKNFKSEDEAMDWILKAMNMLKGIENVVPPEPYTTTFFLSAFIYPSLQFARAYFSYDPVPRGMLQSTPIDEGKIQYYRGKREEENMYTVDDFMDDFSREGWHCFKMKQNKKKTAITTSDYEFWLQR